MRQRGDRYTFEGMIEASAHKHKTQKAGRGSKTKSNVMIMAESTILKDMDTGKVERQARYFKAKVLTDHKMEGTDQTLQGAIDNGDSIVFTDKSTSYVNIADYVDTYQRKVKRTNNKRDLKMGIYCYKNHAKRNFVGTYHKIKAKYLQLYLNEFIYKLNRRYFGERIFDRFVTASVTANGHLTDIQKLFY